MPSVHIPTRTAKLVAGAVVALAAAAPARAQEAPAERWVVLNPAQLGETGTISVINGDAVTREARLEVFTDQAEIADALGTLESGPLRPGRMRRASYTITNDLGEFTAGAAISNIAVGGVQAFVAGRIDGHLVATRLRERVRASPNHTFPWVETAGGDPGTLRLGLLSFGFEDAVTIEVYGADGEIDSTQEVELPPMLAQAVVLDLGDGDAAGGARRVEVRAAGNILADALYVGPFGATFLPHGRDVAENDQYWFPYVNDLTPTVPFSNHVGGSTFSGEVRLFDPKGVVQGNVETYSATASSVTGIAFPPPFPQFGAICVDVLTGTASRAPATTLRGSGDLTVADPMRRIRAGQSGVTPFDTGDAALLAGSVVLVNNPSSLPAVGTLRLRDMDGRVVAQQSLVVRSFENVVVSLSKLVGKTSGGAYLQVVNPPLASASKRRAKKLVGGGDFQAALVLSSAKVADKKRAGQGDGSQLAVLPFLVSNGSGTPTVIAPEVVLPNDDKRGFLTFDGPASNVGKAARLRLVGSNPPLEWKVKAKKAVKLKLKTKSIGSKVLLSAEWPVGEERTFVLIDDLTGGESEAVTVRRGESSPTEE